jgi:hypothetical protein
MPMASCGNEVPGFNIEKHLQIGSVRPRSTAGGYKLQGRTHASFHWSLTSLHLSSLGDLLTHFQHWTAWNIRVETTRPVSNSRVEPVGTANSLAIQVLLYALYELQISSALEAVTPRTATNT